MPTPDEWVQVAQQRLPVLLLDHANCELKAASNAMQLIYRYPERVDLHQKMSRLAREELRHFEQVIAILKKRGIERVNLTAGRYAAGLHKEIRRGEPDRLVDSLIVGAIIEARSCERFEKLVPVLDEQLAGFYQSLLKSESRHFLDYLRFAQQFESGQFDERVQFFLNLEAELITSTDEQFRFHSGCPEQVRAEHAGVQSAN